MTAEIEHEQSGKAARGDHPPVAGLGWVLALFFVSGISGLVYEIIWVHKLTLIFGNTAFAVSTVLGAFMAGLGFGSLWFGRLVERRQVRGLLWYVWLEIGIGIFALVSLPMLEAFEPLYVWCHSKLGATWYVMSLVRLVCAFVTLLPATLLMGGTLPVLCSHFVRSEEGIEPIVAKLYGVNTLGAMAGCFAASFILVGSLGMRKTVAVGAALNFLVALGAWLVAHRGALAESKAAPGDEAVSPAPEEVTPLDYPRWNTRLFLVLVALCGFCGLAYESCWARLLSHVIGLHVQAFGLMLFTFLLGIGVGSMLVVRSRAAQERPLMLFIVVELLIGCFALLSLPLFANIDYFWWLGMSVLGSRSIVARTAIRFFQCIVIMIVPALLMGAAFPLATRLYARSAARVGRDVGNVYAWNTFGAIVGSLAAGFVLMPLFGTNLSVIVVALINFAIGLTLLRSCPGLYSSATGRGALAVLLVAIVATLCTALPSTKQPAVFSARPRNDFKIIWSAEDIAGSVCVLENLEDESEREVNINGLSVAYTAHYDVRVQRLLAHLPILLHRSPKHVLVVGFGSGSTSGTTTLYPVETDCVELQKLEIETAQFFTDLNRNVLDNPRFRIHINDGRNFLLMADGRYDVISRDTLPPKESQDLFSVEFYRLCRSRLNPGGVVCGFLPTDLCPTEAYFKLLVRTFLEAFPEASLWYVGHSCCLLVGTLDRLEIDYNQFVERTSEPAIKEDLEKIHLDDPAVFLCHFLAAGDGLRAFVGPGEVATDDRPIGFGFHDRYLRPDEGNHLMADLLAAREPITDYLVNVGATPAERHATTERLALAHKEAGLVIQAKHLSWLGDLVAASKTFNDAMAMFPDDRGAAYSAGHTAWKACERLLGNGHLGRAAAAAEEAVRLEPQLAKPHAFLGELHEARQDKAKAVEAYRRAYEINPKLVRSRQGLERLGALRSAK